MPLRERIRMLDGRTGGANKNLSSLFESRRKDSVGETAGADETPSQANRVLHTRDSLMPATVPSLVRFPNELLVARYGFSKGGVEHRLDLRGGKPISHRPPAVVYPTRGGLPFVASRHRGLVNSREPNGAPGALVKRMELN